MTPEELKRYEIFSHATKIIISKNQFIHILHKLINLLFLKISQCLFSQEHIEYYLYFLIKSAPVIPVFQPPASYTIIAVLMLFSDTNMRCTEKVE